MLKGSLSIEYCGCNVWIAEAKINGKWRILSYNGKPTYRKAKEDFLRLAVA